MAAMFKLGVPVLPAQDLEVSLAWYRDKLGLVETFRDASPPRYLGLRRDDVHVHLTGVPDGLAKTVAHQTMCRFHVDDVEAYYKEVQERGAAIHPNGPLHDTPWNTREFAVIDPAGVCITFFGVT
jgi:predicted enzyme related to lactoylglutathione lyase